MKDFIEVPVDHASVLGSPLSVGHAMEKTLDNKLIELKRGAERLSLISSHDALVLLKASGSASKLNYILRSSPCAEHTKLSEFDTTMRDTLSVICNVDLSDRNWRQASLPVKMGGLGIRSVADLAPAAFLSSAHGTKATQDSLLSRCSSTPPDEYLHKYTEDWLRTTKQSLPEPQRAHLQHAWDTPHAANTLSALTSSSLNDIDRARILAAAAPHSGDWLHAVPIASCWLRLEDDAIRTAIGFRLGTKVCEPHSCPCGSVVDTLGSHALSCKSNAGKTQRHAFLNDIITRSLVRAGVPSIKEPAGLSRSDGKRPDGITQIPWRTGKSAIWGVTVADTLATSYLSSTA